MCCILYCYGQIYCEFVSIDMYMFVMYFPKSSQYWKQMMYAPQKTNMTMETPPFEDVFPIQNGFFSHVMLVNSGV